MHFLTDYVDDVVYLRKCKFKVNPAFNIVLKIQRLFREEKIDDELKTEQALKMLVKSRFKLKLLTIKEKQELLSLIFKDCINTKTRPPTRQKTTVLDFDYDAEYIYSSFLLDYNIDLTEVCGKLSWKKFIALFEGLSEKTKIREVMRIRSMETPQYNGHNQVQIQEIQELKSYYALPVRGGGGQQGLNTLFLTLERMAVSDCRN